MCRPYGYNTTRTIMEYPKLKTPRDIPYRHWLTEQICCRCYRPPSENLSVAAAHYGKHGTGIKASDYDALPLCVWCHGKEHAGVRTFWDGVDRKELVREHRERYLWVVGEKESK